MCAFAVLKLGELIDKIESSRIVVDLEPQGTLFIEVIFIYFTQNLTTFKFKYLDPIVGRKPKIKRQTHLFKVKGIFKPQFLVTIYQKIDFFWPEFEFLGQNSICWTKFYFFGQNFFFRTSGYDYCKEATWSSSLGTDVKNWRRPFAQS